MPNWNQRDWKPMLIVLAFAAITLLIAACADAAPAVPSNVSPGDAQIDMSETIERLQQIAPELQRHLDQIDKLNVGLKSNCSSAYPQKCIPPAPPVLKCKDLGQKNFLVLPPDPHNFDPDGDGIGCEG